MEFITPNWLSLALACLTLIVAALVVLGVALILIGRRRAGVGPNQRVRTE